MRERVTAGEGSFCIPVQEDRSMAPPRLLSQLLLVALVLVCLLRHGWWPDAPRAIPQPLRPPAPPRRTCSPAPHPLPGCIPTPLCEACEQGANARSQAPGFPPPRIRCPRGRRRPVNPHSHCCPAPACTAPGGLGRGHIRAPGHPGSPPWRQLQGVFGEGAFAETPGPILHGQCSAPARLGRGIACLAAGLGSRGTARGVAIDPHTGLSWVGEAAEPLKAFAAYFLPALHGHPVQLDALSAVRSAGRSGDRREAEARERLARSPRWVGTARAPERTLLLRVQVSERPRALAPAMRQQLVALLASGWVPLCVSDGSPQARPALVAHGGHGGPPPPRPARGALRSSHPNPATAADHRRQPPRGVWHASSGRARVGGLGLADHDGGWGKAQAEPAAAGGGAWAPPRPAVEAGRRLAPATGAVPSLS